METRHILIAVFVAFIWGLNFVMVKSGLEEIPPFLYVCVRYIFAALPLVFFYKKTKNTNLGYFGNRLKFGRM